MKKILLAVLVILALSSIGFAQVGWTDLITRPVPVGQTHCSVANIIGAQISKAQPNAHEPFSILVDTEVNCQNDRECNWNGKFVRTAIKLNNQGSDYTCHRLYGQQQTADCNKPVNDVIWIGRQTYRVDHPGLPAGTHRLNIEIKVDRRLDICNPLGSSDLVEAKADADIVVVEVVNPSLLINVNERTSSGNLRVSNGATVTLDGVVKTTNSNGDVSYTDSSLTVGSSHTLTISKSGYTTISRTVIIPSNYLLLFTLEFPTTTTTISTPTSTLPPVPATVTYLVPALFTSGSVSGSQITVQPNSDVNVKIKLQTTADTSGLVSVEVRKDFAYGTDSTHWNLPAKTVNLFKNQVNTIDMGNFPANDQSVRSYFIKVTWNNNNIYDPTDKDSREWVKLTPSTTTTTIPSTTTTTVPTGCLFSIVDVLNFPQTVNVGEGFTFDVKVNVNCPEKPYGARGVFIRADSGNGNCVRVGRGVAQDCDDESLDDLFYIGERTYTIPFKEKTPGNKVMKIEAKIEKQYGLPDETKDTEEKNYAAEGVPKGCSIKIAELPDFPDTINIGEDLRFKVRVNVNCPEKPSGARGIFIRAETDGECIRYGTTLANDCDDEGKDDQFYSTGEKTYNVLFPKDKLPKTPGNKIMKIEAKIERQWADDDEFKDLIEKNYRAEGFLECKDKPSLLRAEWHSDGARTGKVNLDKDVRGVIELQNLKSDCQFSKSIKIQIKKDVLFSDPPISPEIIKNVLLKPSEKKTFTFDYIADTDGEIHYDVHYNNQKYSGGDNRGKNSGSNDYASDDLIVGEEVKEGLMLKDWGFTLDGRKVASVPEGAEFTFFVTVQAAKDTIGKARLELKSNAWIVGDPVKDSEEENIALIKGETKTISITYTASQDSGLHRESYHGDLYLNDKNVFGRLPPKEIDDLKVIKGNVVVQSYGWFKNNKPITEKTEFPAKAVVVLKETKGATTTGLAEIRIRKDSTMWTDEEVKKCQDEITIQASSTLQFECELNSESGKYHFEYWFKGDKIVERSNSACLVSSGFSLFGCENILDIILGIVFGKGTLWFIIIGIVGLILLIPVLYIVGFLFRAIRFMRS